MAVAASAIPDPRRRFFRVHLWVRVALWGHAAVVDLSRWHVAHIPALLAVVVTAMFVWTIVTSWRYITGPRPRWLFVADVGFTLLVVLLTPVALPLTYVWGVGTTLPGYWLSGASVALAIQAGWRGGAAGGFVLAATAFLLKPSLDPDQWGSVLMVTLASAGLGWMMDQMTAAMRERDSFFQQAAAMGERERLNRIVHDGVLQVLAMVERDGNALGPRGQLLARLAREQEIKLRALLQSKDVDIAAGQRVDAAETNLLTLLDRHESARVTISTMADDLLLPTERAQEIEAVVAEALRNVEKHAGADAHAWVLVEEDDNLITISVRDNGVGAKPQDVLGAFRHGRLGVRQSVVGRVRDLGGETELRAAPGRGVEWEFKIPVQPA